MKRYLGLDIGGAHIKIAVMSTSESGRTWQVDCIPVRADKFAASLDQILSMLVGEHLVDVTIASQTACLLYDDIHQGTTTIMQTLARYSTRNPTLAVDVCGNLYPINNVAQAPERFVCSNVAVTASLVAKLCSNALVLDMGSTSTDLIPIVDGTFEELLPTARLLSSAVLYLGVIRTPLQAVVSHLPYQGELLPVVGETIAAVADALVLTEDVSIDQYTMPTWDSGTKDVAGCTRRLAKLIAMNTHNFPQQAATFMAQYVREELLHKVVAAMYKVISKNPAMQQAFYTGIGSSILATACDRLGIRSDRLEKVLGLPLGIEYTPAVGACLLLELTGEGT